MKKVLLVAALFAFGASAAFAQNAPAAAEKTAKTTKTVKSKKSKKAAASTDVMYECPMKCEPATAKACKCGKCGMDKVKKA